MSNDKQNTENPMENVQSHDWNKERLEQLKQLMPDLFTNDGKLNISELKKVVDPKSVNETERYEFRWFGKSNAKREAFTPTDATLVYDEDRSVNPTESENLIIEGENLAVLKLLSNSYREQVKCIYIDPPYNTGNDFVYSDKFNQDKKEYWENAEMTENGFKIDSNTETDGRFHSNWLNMMYSRLLIARQLLKEDGVIFISIDDNEVHHLRKLCDDVFGEDNYVSTVANINNPKGRSDDKHIATSHEYVLILAKNIEMTNIYGFDLGVKITKRYNKVDNNEREYREIDLRKTGDADLKEDRPEMFYYFYYNEKNKEIQVHKKKQNLSNFIEIIPLREDGKFGRWRWGFDTATDKLNKLISRYMPNRKIWGVFEKDFLDERDFVKATSTWNFKDVNSERGTEDFMSLGFNKEVFQNPKPIGTLKRVLKLVTNSDKDDIVLDFFAGSGSMGQSLSELNQEDGGNRKYILVQLPEATDEKSEAYKAGYKKISGITIERNKRVIEKIIKEKKEATPDLFSKKESEQEQLKGLGFKVFKLQKSNFPRVEFAPDPEKSEVENIELLKKYIKDKEAQLVSAFNKDELITEILIKNGFKLNYTLTKQKEFKKNEILFATDGDKETLICLDVIIADETVEHFKTNTDQKLIVLERALDTTKKWNLKHAMGDKFNAF